MNRQSLTSPRRILSLAAVLVLVVAAVAFAATPKPGQYTTTSGGEGGGIFKVNSDHKDIAKGATAPSTFKCNRVNLVVPKAIAIKSGAFSYRGRVKGQAGTLTFKGHFTTATKANGTSTFAKGSCKSTFRFSAKHL
jgi:hypothetical protein